MSSSFLLGSAAGGQQRRTWGLDLLRALFWYARGHEQRDLALEEEVFSDVKRGQQEVFSSLTLCLLQQLATLFISTLDDHAFRARVTTINGIELRDEWHRVRRLGSSEDRGRRGGGCRGAARGTGCCSER